MGPGTKVFSRVKNHNYPVNRSDFISLLHDIDYLIVSGDKQAELVADAAAIQRAELGGTFLDLILKYGLKVKQWLGLQPNRIATIEEGIDKRKTGMLLLNYIMTNPDWVANLDRYI